MFCGENVRRKNADNRSCRLCAAHVCGRITGVAACARRGLVRRIANKPPHCGHRSRPAYALTHLTSARTAGVRCAMKCLVRRKKAGVRCSVCVSEPQLYQSARKPLALATCRLAVRIVYKPHSSVTVRALHMRSLISLRHAQRVSAVL